MTWMDIKIECNMSSIIIICIYVGAFYVHNALYWCVIWLIMLALMCMKLREYWCVWKCKHELQKCIRINDDNAAYILVLHSTHMCHVCMTLCVTLC